MKRTRQMREVGARKLSTRGALLCLIALVMVCALPRAQGQERNFAGSVQGAYLYAKDLDGEPARQRALDGFTTEVSAKLAVDFGEHVSTAVKMCFGCHGFVRLAHVLFERGRCGVREQRFLDDAARDIAARMAAHAVGDEAEAARLVPADGVFVLTASSARMCAACESHGVPRPLP